jgi:hypothetical protein
MGRIGSVTVGWFGCGLHVARGCVDIGQRELSCVWLVITGDGLCRR